MNLNEFKACLESQGAELTRSSIMDDAFDVVYTYKGIPVSFSGEEGSCGIDILEMKASATLGASVDFEAINKINSSVKYLTAYLAGDNFEKVVFSRYIGLTGTELDQDVLLHDLKRFHQSILLVSTPPASKPLMKETHKNQSSRLQ